MKVLDHAPHAWFLLESDGELYLDVNCSLGALGYSFCIALNHEERRSFQERGRAYLDRLADAVHLSAPLRNALSPYASRGEAALSEAVSAAVAAWRSAR